MNKKVILIGVVLLTIVIGAYYFLGGKKNNTNTVEQEVLSDTLTISQEYSRLRYQTDNVLVKAKDYQNYDDWNKEMTLIIESWKNLENDALKLEQNSQKLIDEKAVLNFPKSIHAYDSLEIQKIIEKAPMGRQVRTLAQHLGVDAKRAHLILNESQNRISREIWGGEGDIYQGLEQDAMRIKNGAKVTVFVGGVVLTGGMSAVATSGVVAKTALVVSGADLVLEVADDEAKIALGDKNKVSKMVGKIRTVTEPAASILTVVNMPGNVSKAMEKISALSFAGDQIRSVVQDEKVLGISIKVDEKGEVKAKVSGLTEEELPKWSEENKVIESGQTPKEIFEQVVKEEVGEVSEEKEIPNQIYKIINVSGTSYMIDVCHTPTCWDDLDADPIEDRDLGGIYTLGKVFGSGEGFKHGFRPADLKASGRLVETSANRYKMSVYFAIAPFEGPKNKTIDYGTWRSDSIEIEANYGDEPVIEWDGASLKQTK